MATIGYLDWLEKTIRGTFAQIGRSTGARAKRNAGWAAQASVLEVACKREEPARDCAQTFTEKTDSSATLHRRMERPL